MAPILCLLYDYLYNKDDLPSSIFKLSTASTGIFELGQANVASFIETQTSVSILSCLVLSFSSEILFSIKLFEIFISDLVHDTFVYDKNVLQIKLHFN